MKINLTEARVQVRTPFRNFCVGEDSVHNKCINNNAPSSLVHLTGLVSEPPCQVAQVRAPEGRTKEAGQWQRATIVLGQNGQHEQELIAGHYGRW